MTRWSESTTLKFVSEYVQHKCLYDNKDVSFKNKEKRYAAYLAIEREMNLNRFGPKEIEQKIKSIRSTYSQELNKIKMSIKYGEDEEDIYVPNVKWFNILYKALQRTKDQKQPKLLKVHDEEYELHDIAMADVLRFNETSQIDIISTVPTNETCYFIINYTNL